MAVVWRPTPNKLAVAGKNVASTRGSCPRDAGWVPASLGQDRPESVTNRLALLGSGAFGIAPAEFQGDGFHIGRDRGDGIAQPLRLRGDQSTSVCTRHAQLLFGAVEENLAVEEAVIVVLARRRL